MNKSNQYFGATVFFGGLVLLAIISLAVKNITPVYQAILQWCGASIEACQQAISTVSPLNILALGILGWFSVIALVQIWQTIFIVRKITSRPLVLPEYLKRIAGQVGLAGRLELVTGNALFCSGFVQPRVILGTDILKTLTKPELTAALSHEAFHLRNRDPLKVLVASVFGRSFFFLPALAEIAQKYLTEKELEADLAASLMWGEKYLAKALYKVLAQANGISPAPLVASFAAESERILRLRGVTKSIGINYWSWGATLVILSLLSLSVFYRPALAIGGCQ